jgi:hypothetical protein
MQMKVSTITAVLPEPEAQDVPQIYLTGELSEWLFVSRFWGEFNVANGTMFDQFEEDEVSADIAKNVALSLKHRIGELKLIDGQSIHFVYRRLQGGGALTCDVTTSALTEELTRVVEFLYSVSERYQRINFDL